jgi:glycosyltransferase involved in cell wall biosynthesis
MLNKPFTPLVSVVIPTLNRPHLVHRAVVSALNQTYDNFEVLVLIDGPDSKTVEALNSISDGRFQKLSLPTNGGPSVARNLGVQAARGEWIAFLDDDDEWLPEKLERQVAAAMDNPAVNFIATRLEEWTATERRIRPDDFPKVGESMSDYWYCRAGLLIPSTFLVKRSLVVALPFTPECRGNEDVDWLLRAERDSLIYPLWMEDVLVIYHSEHVDFRLSTHSKWRERYDWFTRSQSLFSPRSVPYYFGRICIPEAKKSSTALRDCAFLLKESAFRGRLTLRSLAYLIIVVLTSRETRAKLRRGWAFVKNVRSRSTLEARPVTVKV